MFCILHEWKLTKFEREDRDVKFFSLIPFGFRLDKTDCIDRTYKCQKCGKEKCETEMIF